MTLLRSPDAPEAVAGGLALGLFIALLPIMGLQMPVAVGAAEVLRRGLGWKLSRLAAAAGVWLTNPLTAAPIYGLAYLVGRPFASLFLPKHAEEGLQAADLASAGLAVEVVLALVIGGVLLGIPTAAAGYHLTLRALRRYQERRAARRARSMPPPVRTEEQS